ncbi:BspA family leucine-rich repeat surface protein [Williamsoniiplasma lucivorax]|uniref:Lipoprotein n=1 Tax=Williamsoniiplasma lucivorax TaxID=209274 RepID=A0A2S5RD95_9MOLU|nr:BspA family leucine-rich repeat surface protein [Williamsoniiplasma lucivorax]PPE05268.1 hypothetical protein ELUCI_v1c08040 [Williamsoniiplasma lucivorax]
MKKILSLLFSLAVFSPSALLVVSCGKNINNSEKQLIAVSSIEGELTTILTSQSEQWDLNQLQNQIDTQFGDGEITVRRVPQSQTKNFDSQEIKDSLIFKGNADISNSYVYFDEISLDHTYTIKEDTTIYFDDEMIQKFNEILNSEDYLYQPWTVEAFQAELIKQGICDENVKITKTDYDWLEGDEQKEATFTIQGLGNIDNLDVYGGSVSIKHKYTHKILIDINKIVEIVSDDFIHEYMFQSLETSIIQTELNENHGENQIIVNEPVRNSETIDDSKIIIHTDTYELNGQAKPTNSLLYYGTRTLTHHWIENIEDPSFAKTKTIYQAKGKVEITESQNFSEIKADIIYKLGIHQKGNDFGTLIGVKAKIVPSTLPKEITNISQMFQGNQYREIKGIENWDTRNVKNMTSVFEDADLFNGNITNWSVSKVTSISKMFKNAKVFNQDLSKWRIFTSKVDTSEYDAGLSFNSWAQKNRPRFLP